MTRLCQTLIVALKLVKVAKQQQTMQNTSQLNINTTKSTGLQVMSVPTPFFIHPSSEMVGDTLSFSQRNSKIPKGQTKIIKSEDRQDHGQQNYF